MPGGSRQTETIQKSGDLGCSLMGSTLNLNAYGGSSRKGLRKAIRIWTFLVVP